MCVVRKRCKMETNFESRPMLKIVLQISPTIRKCSKIVSNRLQNTFGLLLKRLVEGALQKSYISISKPLNSQKYATNLKCVDELKICFKSRVTVDCVKKWRRILGVTKCKKPSGSLQSLYRSKISLRKKAY